MIRFWRKHLYSQHPSGDLWIQDIISPFILVSSLFGLLPHSYKYSRFKQSFITIPNSIYLNSLCAVIVLICLFSFGTFHVRYMFTSAEKKQFNQEFTVQLNYVLEFVMLTLLCCIIYVYTFLNRSRYVRIFNAIVAAWNDVPFSKESRVVLEKMSFQRNMMILGLCGIIIVKISVNFTRREGMWKKTLVCFSFYMPQLIQFILHAFYIMLVISVTAILQNINAHCRLLADGEHPSYPFIEVKPKVKRMTFRQMESIYMKVFDIKTDINEVFQGPMLASVMQSFHALVGEAHILYHGVIVDKHMSLHEIVNCSIWGTYQLIKLYSLTYSGSLLKFEALKTGQKLHCIPHENKDQRWLMEIQHFSTLLKYQSMEINIFGFFPLDGTFMYNMIASAAMYLIILVQFDTSD